MTIKELREEWEEDLVVEQELVIEELSKEDYTLIVLLSCDSEEIIPNRLGPEANKQKLYSLHKYFKVGNNWQCDVRVQNKKDSDLFKGIFKLIKQIARS